MTRTTAKNRMNKILSETTKGLYSDECWAPVGAAWKALTAAGFEPMVLEAKYGHDDSNGNPVSKTWKFEVAMETGKPMYGVITAHGAGTVADPLSRYDISAYVC